MPGTSSPLILSSFSLFLACTSSSSSSSSIGILSILPFAPFFLLIGGSGSTCSLACSHAYTALTTPTTGCVRGVTMGATRSVTGCSAVVTTSSTGDTYSCQ